MAGTLTIDTLKASSGVLATQNGMTGICKAWVNYNASTQTIIGSFNVSSVTRNSTGNCTVTFTTAMPSTAYSVVAGVKQVDSSAFNGNGSMLLPYSLATGSFIFVTGDGGGTLQNMVINNIAVFA